jgi:hypothetical protein
MDPSRENVYGFKGVLWVCFMGDEIPGASTHLLWDHFDGKIHVNNILYNILWAPADERRAWIIIMADKKSW